MRSLRCMPATALFTWGALLVLGASAGCAATSPAMKRGAARSLNASLNAPLMPPPPGYATVIFVRTSSLGPSESFQLFDQKKRFLGDSLPGSHFIVALRAGPHWLYASAENTTVMRADLEAGKRYFVLVRPSTGMWSARVELLSLARNPRDWSMRERLVSKTVPMIPVLRVGQAALDEETAELDAEIRQAGEAWRRASNAWQASHSLLAEDGEATSTPTNTPARAPQPVASPAPIQIEAPPAAVPAEQPAPPQQPVPPQQPAPPEQPAPALDPALPDAPQVPETSVGSPQP